MCIEDIRIGRYSRAYNISTVMGAVAIEIVPEDKNRLCLILGAPTSGTLFWSHDPAVTVLTGIPLPTGFPPIVLNVKDHGEIVTGKVFGIISAGTPNVSVMCSSFHMGQFLREQLSQ